MNRTGLYRSILVMAVGGMLACVAQADSFETGPINQAAFQALVDAASSGDTITARGGIYDFTAPGPVFLSRKLAIIAEDSDDPPIFIGDGTFGTHFIFGNNGFVQSAGSYIEALKMGGLVFRDFERAISFTLNNHDLTLPGCPLIPGAGTSNIEILDNTFLNVRRAVQAFGGPYDDFVIKGNHIEVADIFASHGVIIQGSVSGCPFDGSLLNFVRPTKGVIENNHIEVPGGFGINFSGVEEATVKENHIETGVAGIAVGDDTAFFLPDDGPVKLGTVQDNIVESADAGPLVVGIYGFGPTTTEAEFKDNVISDAILGIMLDTGATGFKITSNEFSGNVVAEIWLGFDEGGDPLASPPDTHDNYVEAQSGDRVFDFGVDNEVVIKD